MISFEIAYLVAFALVSLATLGFAAFAIYHLIVGDGYLQRKV